MPNKRASLFAFTGGLLHIALVGSLLFLPVLATRFQKAQETICDRQSYMEQGGNFLGFDSLLLLVARDHVWRTRACTQWIYKVATRQ